MPRPPRLRVAGVPQHVLQRGIDRQAVFFEDFDRRFYLDCLAETARWYDLDIHAYCLMTNHVHLLVTPRHEDALWRSMQRLGSHYVRYVNDRSERTGTLWEGRYRACLVDSDTYLLACYRYVESNPVRAGMFASSAAYPWSSHRSNALGWHNPLLTPHEAYLALGNSAPARRASYRGLFGDDLPDDTLAAIRGALHHNHVLGNDRFRAQIERMLGRRVGTGRPGRPPRPHPAN